MQHVGELGDSSSEELHDGQGANVLPSALTL